MNRQTKTSPENGLPGNLVVHGRYVSAQTGTEEFWHVPVEVPVAFVVGNKTVAIMLATPADLDDYAYGFTLGEGLVDAPDEILSVDIHPKTKGIDITLSLSSDRMERFAVRHARRDSAGTSSCGLCGIDSEERLFRKLPMLPYTASLPAPDLVAKALAGFSGHQPLRRLNHSVHGAAWVRSDGTIITAREDVGRHNAVDKLIGHMMREGIDPQSGFMLISSRCSFEMVEKCARAKIGSLISISAPTSFAIEKAGEAGIRLGAIAGDGVMTF